MKNMEITIFGKGNMGQAIGKNFAEAGNNVQYYGSKDTAQQLGNIVVMAVPYPALAALAKQYQAELAGKIVVDITNPLNFETWDELVVPADSSAAQQLQELLPESKVLKAFNTNFAATLQSGKIGELPTTVLVAGDDEEAKAAFKSALASSALRVLNAGKLKRAREMEATGFLQMTLAASKQIGWDGGFGVVGNNK
jgi:predicted dinucleotide-binding enzyme